MRAVVATLACAVIAAAAWTLAGRAPLDVPVSSSLIAAQPVQGKGAGRWWQAGRYRLDEAATYALTARVLARERYWLDRGADLSPIDLALGWGPMLKPEASRGMRVRQSRRWYFLSWTTAPALTQREIMANTANVHVIPATKAVRSQLLSLSAGEIWHFEGHLVNASRPDGFTWSTSMSRDDTGAGACELFLVTDISRPIAS